MRKRAFIIHGWGGKPNEHWLPWLKQQLESEGFEVHMPQMPNTDEPVIEEWVSFLTSEVGDVDKETYFIGHSIGCQAILRFLASQDNQAAKCIFVAGWFRLEGEIYDEGEEVIGVSKPWMETPIDFEKVKQVTSSISVFLSDNEPYNAVEQNKKTFEGELGAAVTIMHNKGHFTAGDGVIEFPEILEVITRSNEQ